MSVLLPFGCYIRRLHPAGSFPIVIGRYWRFPGLVGTTEAPLVALPQSAKTAGGSWLQGLFAAWN